MSSLREKLAGLNNADIVFLLELGINMHRIAHAIHATDAGIVHDASRSFSGSPSEFTAWCIRWQGMDMKRQSIRGRFFAWSLFGSA